MKRHRTESQAKPHDGKRLRWGGVLLVFSLVIVATIVSVILWQRLPEVVAKDRTPLVDETAAMDIGAVLQVTPEYVMMSRYSHDLPQYRILQRKARLKVVAAAQHAARDMGYSAVLCWLSSDLPDITEQVAATLVSPSADFRAVADLSVGPFTGNLIHVPV
jgi:hypothetical protein